jgi:hypothetical protein
MFNSSQQQKINKTSMIYIPEDRAALTCPAT